MKRIEDYLKYDETSKTYLRWIKCDANNVREGNEAFTAIGNCGYYVGRFNHKKISAHRVIMYLFYRKWSSRKLQIDHIDSNKFNNNINNLRFVTPSENQKNLNDKVRKDNLTRIRGLQKIKYKGKVSWRARLFNKHLYQGNSKEIAIEKLEKAKRDYRLANNI